MHKKWKWRIIKKILIYKTVRMHSCKEFLSIILQSTWRFAQVDFMHIQPLSTPTFCHKWPMQEPRGCFLLWDEMWLRFTICVVALLRLQTVQRTNLAYSCSHSPSPFFSIDPELCVESDVQLLGPVFSLSFFFYFMTICTLDVESSKLFANLKRKIYIYF